MDDNEAIALALESLGLSERDRKVAAALIQRGPMGAQRLASAIGMQRTNTYNALASLEARNLVTRKRDRGASRYTFAGLQAIERHLIELNLKVSHVTQTA